MKGIGIIAHRGGFLPEGPIPLVRNRYTIPENTLAAFKRAFENEWAIETDVRFTKDGKFVISHDDINQTDLIGIPMLSELCELISKYKVDGKTPLIAFQIKRNTNLNDGVEIGRAVAESMQRYGLKESILFDATLEEAQILHREFPWLNLSVSVGEKNYSPTIYTPDQVLTPSFTSIYTSVWADEWKISGSVYNEEVFKKLRSAYPGRIDIISPELHYNENHPLSRDLKKLKDFWKELALLGLIDGVCTDYPSTLTSII